MAQRTKAIRLISSNGIKQRKGKLLKTLSFADQVYTKQFWGTSTNCQKLLFFFVTMLQVLFAKPQHLTWVQEFVMCDLTPGQSATCQTECRWSHFPRSSVPFRLLGNTVQPSPKGGEEKPLPSNEPAKGYKNHSLRHPSQKDKVQRNVWKQ